MTPINDDILACILAQLDTLYQDGRSEQTICSVILACKAFQGVATAELYRYPFLNVHNLPAFAATIIQDPSLARHIRGITFDTRARPAYRIWREFDLPESERVHRTSCMALRQIMESAPYLDALAVNPRESWKLDSELKSDASDDKTDIFHAFFGYCLGESGASKPSPFRRLHLDGSSLSLETNVWRLTRYAEATAPKAGHSLSLYNMIDGSDLLMLPRSDVPMRLYLIGCTLSFPLLTQFLARFASCLIELSIRNFKCDVDVAVPLETFEKVALPNLRRVESDTLCLPVLDAPALQELHVTANGTLAPMRLLEWVHHAEVASLQRISFLPRGKFPHRHEDLSRQGRSQLKADLNALSALCHERSIQLQPRIWEAGNMLLGETRWIGD